MSEPRRAAQAARFFEDTIRRLRAERGDHDPLAIANAGFAAVHARYGDLSGAEAAPVSIASASRRAASLACLSSMGCSAVFQPLQHPENIRRVLRFCLHDVAADPIVAVANPSRSDQQELIFGDCPLVLYC